MEHWEVVNNANIVASDSPEALWYNAVRYFKWNDANPIRNTKTLKDGRVISNINTRPYSIKALCLHCGILEEYLRDVRASKDRDSLYYIVVSKILYLIYVQNLEGGITNEFNPIMISKVLNIDKEDIPTGAIKVIIEGGLPSLSESEDEVIGKMEAQAAF
jgi:hypothetical protein